MYVNAEETLYDGGRICCLGTFVLESLAEKEPDAQRLFPRAGDDEAGGARRSRWVILSFFIFHSNSSVP